MSICILDTSVFCPILNVPNKSANQKEVLQELKEKLKRREELLLPMTTILETGNHIGQNGDGTLRRQTAKRFADEVTKALKGLTPFRPTPLVDDAKLITLLADFPDWAGRSDAKGKGSGLGDLTIYNEWLRLCEIFPQRRVYIWSQDAQLSAYDSHPPA